MAKLSKYFIKNTLKRLRDFNLNEIIVLENLLIGLINKDLLIKQEKNI